MNEQSKYINGYSIENIKCEEFPICAEARENLENFNKYCTGNELCPYECLTTDRNDERILMEMMGATI